MKWEGGSEEARREGVKLETANLFVPCNSSAYRQWPYLYIGLLQEGDVYKKKGGGREGVREERGSEVGGRREGAKWEEGERERSGRKERGRRDRVR